MNWNKIESTDQLAHITQESNGQPILLFKHSTRCSISSAALARLERSWVEDNGIKPYYLDLLAYRPLSMEIAALFGVEHESPQALLISNGKCVYHESHMGINVSDMLSVL
ncbi:MAG: bacillithiol system redox-active protein YtxJ [Bacteroidota bacterium]